MYPQKHFNHYHKYFWLVLSNNKDWATLMQLATFVICHLLSIILLLKYLSELSYITCREYLVENRLSGPSAPRWVLHSYLVKGLRLIPYTYGSSTCHGLHSTSSTVRKTHRWRSFWERGKQWRSHLSATPGSCPGYFKILLLTLVIIYD
ncbi:hypothetical protein D1007_61638 [Hordeum vulgare]|nr:hypothetical protein D1007_61638 [Hordeum vulgare]